MTKTVRLRKEDCYCDLTDLEGHGILEYRTEIEDGFIICEEG